MQWHLSLPVLLQTPLANLISWPIICRSLYAHGCTLSSAMRRPPLSQILSGSSFTNQLSFLPHYCERCQLCTSEQSQCGRCALQQHSTSVPAAVHVYTWLGVSGIDISTTKIKRTYIQTSSPYRTVNTHRLCYTNQSVNPLNPELNPICYLLALLGAHHFLHVSRIRVKLLTFRRLMLYIYGAPILDVSRSHTTTQHSR